MYCECVCCLLGIFSYFIGSIFVLFFESCLLTGGIDGIFPFIDMDRRSSIDKIVESYSPFSQRAHCTPAQIEMLWAYVSIDATHTTRAIHNVWPISTLLPTVWKFVERNWLRFWQQLGAESVWCFLGNTPNWKDTDAWGTFECVRGFTRSFYNSIIPTELRTLYDCSKIVFFSSSTENFQTHFSRFVLFLLLFGSTPSSSREIHFNAAHQIMFFPKSN